MRTLFPLLLNVLVAGTLFGAAVPPSSPFAILDDRAAWKLLPLTGADAGQPLPGWARVLAGPLPRTTAAMLELDLLHRRDTPLGVALASKVRWVAARANGCAWTEAVARADLKRVGVVTEKPTARDADEQVILDFAHKLTTAAYSVTDDEVVRLRKQLGEAKLVALVQLIAYANYQDRLVLALGVTGEVRPPLDVRLDRMVAGIEAPARRPPVTRPAEVKILLDDPTWTNRAFDDLQKSMLAQKAREPRIAVPSWEDVTKRLPKGAPVPPRPVRIRWSLVCMGYQPELATAWSACTRSFGEEAKQDRVFEESLFWVVTRSLTCFY